MNWSLTVVSKRIVLKILENVLRIYKISPGSEALYDSYIQFMYS